MFQFDEIDTRIFEYSKGERDENGQFKTVFADPAVIKRQLDISLPDRIRLIDQVLAAEEAKRRKAGQIAAYEADPDGYMKTLVVREHGYQPLLPDPEQREPGATIPNPEGPLEYAKRLGVQPPTEYQGEENAAIRMGGIADAKLNAGIRAAFGLLDFDEKTGLGCTDYMVVAIYNHWQDWLEKKSGNTPEPPTSSPPSPEASASTE